MNLAAFPSPSDSVWHLGPIPIRAYSLCIVLGILAAVWITERRLRQRGAPAGTAVDMAIWAVPLGIVGARVYHVLTWPEPYFGADGDPMDALRIWSGGLGIPGAIIGGAIGVWIACRNRRIPFSIIADAAAVGLPVAQAIGRIGNWFNQELYGRPTDVFWAVEIDPEHRGAIDEQYRTEDTFHPTFLYEALWNLGVAGLVWYIDRRYRLGRGRAFALYLMAYTVGRFWIEWLRIDEANTFLGLRWNMWMSVIVFVAALGYFLVASGPRQYLEVTSDGSVRVVDAPTSTEPAGQEAREADADSDRADRTDTSSPQTESSTSPTRGSTGLIDFDAEAPTDD